VDKADKGVQIAGVDELEVDVASFIVDFGLAEEQYFDSSLFDTLDVVLDLLSEAELVLAGAMLNYDIF
jgi:hypothetical protein